MKSEGFGLRHEGLLFRDVDLRVEGLPGLVFSSP